MRKQRNSTTLFLFVVMVLLLVGIHHVISQEPAGSDEEVLAELSNRFRLAQEEQLAIYAPESLAQAREIYARIMARIESGESLRIHAEEVQRIREMLDIAFEKAAHAKEVLHDLHESRREALDLRVPGFAREQFNRAEELAREAVQAIERGDERHSRQMVDEARHVYRMALFETLNQGVIQRAMDALAEQEHRIRPESMQAAVRQLDETRRLLESQMERGDVPFEELVARVGDGINRAYQAVDIDIAAVGIPHHLLVKLIPGIIGIDEEADEGSAGAGAAYTYPVLDVKKSVDKTTIAVGEYATVSIKVTGDAQTQTQSPPLAVVLTLDESGSMQSDCGYSRAAAKDVIKQLTPNVDKVALVIFSTNAVQKVALTTNHQLVVNALNGLGTPSGSTNLKAAFDLSNTILKTETKSFNKMVILFTDGYPTSQSISGIDSAQLNYINNNLHVPQMYNIQYFTVSYGKDTPKTDLKVLAEKTGGKYYDANQASQLSAYFTNAVKSLQKILKTRNVVIKEYVGKDFMVKSGSLTYSVSGGASFGTTKFDNDMKTVTASFYKTGVLLVPTIYLLDDNRTFSVDFDVTAKGCKAKDTALDVDDIKSVVEYSPGSTIKYIKPIPQKKITVKKCGVYIDKKFKPESRTVEISIRNTFSDRKVYGIYIREKTGKDVEPLMGTVKPGWPTGMPWYPANATTTWKVYGIEWKMDNIPPKTTQVFSFQIKVFASATKKEPGEWVVINPKPLYMLPYPDLGTKHPDYIYDTQIKYWYKDNFGKKVIVDKPLPALSYPGLKPQWPYE